LSDFQRGKLYDLLAVSPLVGWYIFSLFGLVPQLAALLHHYAVAHDLRSGFSAASMIATLAFLVVQILLSLIRVPPQQFSPNWLSRIVALAGANMGLALLLLHRVELPLFMQAVSAGLTTFGLIASVYVASRLGRAFSVFPQARRLVTAGPYKHIRHPLYLTEQIALFGVMLQYQQPWALLIALAFLALHLRRMDYEERVLGEAYPAYREYAERTARLIPGIY